MALLKKVKASTLMETLVATVLIVVIFMVSSLVLNNLMRTRAQNNADLAKERMHALEYQYKNKAIELPYYEDFESWEITILQKPMGQKTVIALEAKNITDQVLVTNFIADEE